MNFFCPKCSPQDRSLTIKALIELPSDARSDEITLQIIACKACGFSGIAIYEESRRGALDRESFSHTGYMVIEQDLNWLREQINRCPDPRDPRCNCPVHQKLGAKDSRGYWIGVKNIKKEAPFQIEI